MEPTETSVLSDPSIRNGEAETLPLITSDEPPADTLGSQIARTDAALVAWRDESVRRRAEYDERVALERAEADRRRRRMMRAAGLLSVAGISALATFAAGLAWMSWPAPAPSPAPVAPPVVAVAPPIVEPVTEPVAAPVVVETPPPAPAFAIEPGTTRIWTDRKHVWVAFHAAEAGPIELHWKDAAGAEALEPMKCATADCRAGRSHGRIALALANGAAPGTWTISACGERGCADVGTFPTPSRVAPPHGPR
jgi:hypothetical protein